MDIFQKTTNEKLPYFVDWSAVIGADTISSQTFTVDTGITAVSNSHTNTVSTIILSGGSPGVTYTITCAITTAGSYIYERTFKVNGVTQKFDLTSENRTVSATT